MVPRILPSTSLSLKVSAAIVVVTSAIVAESMASPCAWLGGGAAITTVASCAVSIFAAAEAAATPARCGLTTAASAASAQNFSDLARQDLQAMHAALRDNHPAAVVPGDASAPFRAWLDAGLQQAQAKAGQVNSGDSHAYLLRWYANGFRDSNIAARPTYEGLGPFFATSWPGVATAWRNGQYVVSYVQPGVRGAPPLGAVLKSCNAEPIEDLAKAKLDQFEGDLTTEAGRVRSAPYLLWNRNNPMTTGVPGTCEFQVGRRTRDFTLSPRTWKRPIALRSMSHRARPCRSRR